MQSQDVNAIAKMIDHTLLVPEATRADVEKICEQAEAFNFFAVCVNPWWVRTAVEKLTGSNVKVCSVIGFPLGMGTAKVREAEQVISDGADELDVVMAVGALKSGQNEAVKNDIQKVVALGKPVKVILETCLLTDEEIKQACLISAEAGASFVKTSTGFSSGGAVSRVVRLMHQTIGNQLGVKAAGGIKTIDDVMAMIRAGATRIGTSSSVDILRTRINRRELPPRH